MANARPLIDWVPEGGLRDPDAILDRAAPELSCPAR